MKNNSVTITEKAAVKSFAKAKKMLDGMCSKLDREFGVEDSQFIEEMITGFIKDKNIESIFKNEVNTKGLITNTERIFREAEEFSNNSKKHYEASIRIAAFVNNICSHLSDNLKKADALLFMQKINGIRDGFFPLVFGYKAIGSDK